MSQTSTKTVHIDEMRELGVHAEGGRYFWVCAKCTKNFQTTKKNLAYMTVDKFRDSAYKIIRTRPAQMLINRAFWEIFRLFYDQKPKNKRFCAYFKQKSASFRLKRAKTCRQDLLLYKNKGCRP